MEPLDLPDLRDPKEPLQIFDLQDPKEPLQIINLQDPKEPLEALYFQHPLSQDLEDVEGRRNIVVLSLVHPLLHHLLPQVPRVLQAHHLQLLLPLDPPDNPVSKLQILHHIQVVNSGGSKE